LCAGEHSLVNEDAGAEGRNIKRRGAIGGAAVLDLVAGEEKEEFEGVVGQLLGVRPRDEELFDFGGRSGGLFTEDAEVDGDGPPAKHLEATAGDDLFGDAADVGLGIVVGSGQKKEADPEIALAVKALAKFFDFTAEKFGGDLGEDAGTVAGFGVGIESAPVGELADATKGPLQDGMGLAALDVRDEADPAGVVLMSRMVKALGWGKPIV